MYSRAASVTRGHHDKSRDRSLRKFSAMSSMPSSVILEQPDKESTVRLGKVCTEIRIKLLIEFLLVICQSTVKSNFDRIKQVNFLLSTDT